MAADVLSPSVAAAVSKEARHGVYRAELKPVTEHVTGCVPPTSSITAIVPQHGCLSECSPAADRLLSVVSFGKPRSHPRCQKQANNHRW
jgi:hypothetical protein